CALVSVRVVFYEPLAGRKPFVGEDYLETMEKVRSEDPLSLQETVAGLSSALAGAIHRALSKEPAGRYQTLEALKVDLLSVPDLTPPDSGAETLRNAVDRRFSEVLRLHRILVAALGSDARGEETLRLADVRDEPGTGLETVLRSLDDQTERLRGLVRTAERLEPAVARGIAAYERGAYTEAVAELDGVLREVPHHQRAREYRERASRDQHLRAPTRGGLIGSTGIHPLRDGAPYSLTAYESDA